MGLGLQGGGVGAARFFAEKGAKVTVTDLKTEVELARSLRELRSLSITYVLGKHQEEDFKDSDLVIRNPDVPQDSPYLKIAKDNGVAVEMDESLFLKLCPNRENVIGITGTRGKTTTTHLIGAILKKAGFPTLLGGNLRGVATLSLLDQVRPDSEIVLELSSWQLQGLDWDKISPHIAVITNIYPDHLNRYKSLEDYIADKKIIFKYQSQDDYLILNQDNKQSFSSNEISKRFADEAKSKVIFFSKKDLPPVIINSFHLKGGHNLENLAAAYQTAKIFKISDELINEAIKDFTGVEFRLQEIAQVDGVTYVNDTTSTTPEAVIAALKAYEGKQIVLICGGSSKKLDLTKMAEEVGKRVKTVVLLKGNGTDELTANSQWPTANGKMIGIHDNLEKAVAAARNTAKAGDVILLSPGFTSFGMFKNEFERGEKFNDIVKAL